MPLLHARADRGAARTGKPAYANTRGELERVYPDAPVRYAASSLAVPLKVAGEVVGSTGSIRPPACGRRGHGRPRDSRCGGGRPGLERARLHELEQSQRLKAELAADRTRLLQDVAEHLTAAGTAAEVGEVIAGQAAGALAADAVLVYECDADRRLLRLLAHAGFSDEVVEAKRVLSLEVPSPEADVIHSDRRCRCGRERRFSSATARFSRLRSSRTRSRRIAFRSGPGRGRSALCASSIARRPCSTRGFSPSPARFSSRAPSRSTGVSATRRSASRADGRSGCRRSPPACPGALTSGDVAAIFIQAVIDSIGADAAALSIVDDDTGQMHAVAWRGVPDELIEERGVSLAAERPGAKALRRRRPAYYESIDELAADFPQSRERAEASGMQTLAYLPLWAAGSAVGLAVLGWREPSASPGTTGRSSRRSPASALSRSTARGATRRSATSRRRCSGACCPRRSRPWRACASRSLPPGSSAVDVGGDWFDTLTLADGNLGFVVGDVVGKGVEAAATMAQLRNGMRALTLDRRTPGETVTKLNLLLASYTTSRSRRSRYVTLDPRTLARRSRSPATRRRSSSSPTAPFASSKAPAGCRWERTPRRRTPSGDTTLEPGATVVLYTDGLVERPTA